MAHKDTFPHLFAEYTLRGLRLANRIVVSPMCQYSAEDGFANDWHFAHLAARAVGGAGMILTEAVAVVPEGRISPFDLGLWSDEQIGGLSRITSFIREQGVVPGIQVAHAGRRASMTPAWEQPRALSETEGGWSVVVGPSAVQATEHHAVPHALELPEIAAMQLAFVGAAERALRAGFLCLELHAAHGYLFHQFLSPLSNLRTDHYGGSFANRCRFLLETVRAVRKVWREDLPLLVRLSATDWLEFDEALTGKERGWTADDTVQLAALLREEEVDLVDVTTGGNAARVRIPTGPGYQVAFAERVRREAGIPTSAVGIIGSPEQADTIVRSGQADLVMLAREMLRNPYWPLRAAEVLHQEVPWPVQYQRAAQGRKPPRTPLVTSTNLSRKGIDDMTTTTELDQRQETPLRTPSDVTQTNIRDIAAGLNALLADLRMLTCMVCVMTHMMVATASLIENRIDQGQRRIWFLFEATRA